MMTMMISMMRTTMIFQGPLRRPIQSVRRPRNGERASTKVEEGSPRANRERGSVHSPGKVVEAEVEVAISCSCCSNSTRDERGGAAEAGEAPADDRAEPVDDEVQAAAAGPPGFRTGGLCPQRPTDPLAGWAVDEHGVDTSIPGIPSVCSTPTSIPGVPSVCAAGPPGFPGRGPLPAECS